MSWTIHLRAVHDGEKRSIERVVERCPVLLGRDETQSACPLDGEPRLHAHASDEHGEPAVGSAHLVPAKNPTGSALQDHRSVLRLDVTKNQGAGSAVELRMEARDARVENLALVLGMTPDPDRKARERSFDDCGPVEDEEAKSCHGSGASATSMPSFHRVTSRDAGRGFADLPARLDHALNGRVAAGGRRHRPPLHPLDGSRPRVTREMRANPGGSTWWRTGTASARGFRVRRAATGGSVSRPYGTTSSTRAFGFPERQP